MGKTRMLALTAIILTAAAARLLPHPPNVTPITAMAIFGGACFVDRRMAILIPLAAMVLGDFVLGFHRLVFLVYGCFVLDVALGFWVRRHRTWLSVAGAAFAGSVIFFVVTNLGVWGFESLYPKTAEGLETCFTAALPFFRNTILGDLGYTMVLFGSLAAAEAKFQVLRESC